MVRKPKTSDFIFPLILVTIILCITIGLIMYLYGQTPKPNENKIKYMEPVYSLHEYDYVLEVDGTDSPSVYYVYDNRHQLLGVVESCGIDSIINLDNE